MIPLNFLKSYGLRGCYDFQIRAAILITFKSGDWCPGNEGLAVIPFENEPIKIADDTS